MICDHPECTGRHSNNVPVAERCPGAVERKRRNENAKYAANLQWKESRLARKRKTGVRRLRPSDYAECCREGGKKCQQHRQWTDFIYEASRAPLPNLYSNGLGEIDDGYTGGYSVRRDPDALFVDSAEDRMQERAIAAWLKSTSNQEEPWAS